MKPITNHTALLIFSRTAGEECAKKKLITGNKNQNFIAVKMLIERSKSIAKQSGLPLFIHTEFEQRGNSFGEKLYTSIARILQEGFERIIVIGNDCPQLSAKHINIACSQLDRYDQVLAPTNNGGVYLMGFTKTGFQKELAHIRWQTEYVYQDLKALATINNSTVYNLDYLNDVNNDTELLKELYFLPAGNRFRILLQSIISSLHKPYYLIAEYIERSFNSYIILRGPPAVNLL